MTLFGMLKQATAALLGGPAVRSAPERQVRVGTGADNEFEIVINGVPNLFRDEGDHVVHFVAVFDSQITNTAFGHKVLPEVVPRWHQINIRRGDGVTPQSVAEDVMREARGTQKPGPRAAEHRNAGGGESRENEAAAAPVQASSHAEAAREVTASRSTYTIGALLEWGEMEFPNRKPGGKPTYTSFAVRLDTGAGEKTLQGEGLKEPLADLRCKIGDKVGIKRLHKEKVPAFNHKTGRPILDPDTGEQKLWDRWVWQINRIH